MAYDKSEYVKPELNVLGTFEALTQHAASGTKTDVTFGSQAPNVFS